MKKNEFCERILEIINEKIDNHQELIDQLYDDIFQIRKICSKCQLILPANTKYFAFHPGTRDKLQSQCRKCQSNANEVSAAKRKEKERIETGHQIEEIWSDYIEEYLEPTEEIDDYLDEFLDYQEQ